MSSPCSFPQVPPWGMPGWDALSWWGQPQRQEGRLGDSQSHHR